MRIGAHRMNNLISRLEEFVKGSSLGRLFTKKMHIYCIGAPKTGTMSVAEVFRERFRAAHEPQPRESIEFVLAFQTGEIARPEVLDLLKLRDNLLGLDCEAAHYLVFIAPLLVEVFPDARFLFPVRHPRSWLRSVINQTLNSPREYLPEHHVQLRDHNYGPVPQRRPVEEQALGSYSDLHGLAGYLGYWSYHHDRVLDVIPTDRLFLFEISELSSTLDEIATFVGIRPSTLNRQKSHVHEAPRQHRVLDSVPSEYVDGLILKICGPTISRLQSILGIGAWHRTPPQGGGDPSPTRSHHP